MMQALKNNCGLIKAAIFCILAAGCAYSENSLEIDHGPLKIWGAHEIGMLQSGVFANGDVEFTDVWLDNFGAAFIKQAVINQKTRLSVGLSGVFRYPKPERPDITFGGTQVTWFYVGPAVAEGTYMFLGDYDSPRLSLSMGSFPYKYNPDASNLGEYLFRSTAYPTTVTTGGITTINNNSAYLQGMKLNWTLGGLSTDLLLTTETGLPPFYDFSLSLVSNARLAGGLFEIGGGVSLKRIIPIYPDITTPYLVENAYFKDSGGRTLVGNEFYYQFRQTFYTQQKAFHDSVSGYLNSAIADIATPPGQLPALQSQKDLADNQSAYYGARSDSLEQIASGIRGLKQQASATSVKKVLDSLGAKFYSNQNVSLMVRAAMDLKKLFDAEIFSERDLRIYMEVDLLGWRNYPIFYEDRMSRAVIMAGVNLPAFKLLDLLSIQVEYFNSPYLNNHLSLGNGNIPQPYFSPSSNYSRNDFMDITDDDNYYWSVLATKQILPGVHLSAQAGRDHLRVSSAEYFYGSREDPNEALVRSEDWYWMVQLSWGL